MIGHLIRRGAKTVAAVGVIEIAVCDCSLCEIFKVLSFVNIILVDCF